MMQSKDLAMWASQIEILANSFAVVWWILLPDHSLSCEMIVKVKGCQIIIRMLLQLLTFLSNIARCFFCLTDLNLARRRILLCTGVCM